MSYRERALRKSRYGRCGKCGGRIRRGPGVIRDGRLRHAACVPRETQGAAA